MQVLVSRMTEKSREHRLSSASEAEHLMRKCLAHLEQPKLNPLPSSLQADSKPTLTKFVLGSLASLVLFALLLQIPFKPEHNQQVSNSKEPGSETESNEVEKIESHDEPSNDSAGNGSSKQGAGDENAKPIDVSQLDRQSQHPFAENGQLPEFWRLSLKECISIGLQNAKLTFVLSTTSLDDPLANGEKILIAPVGGETALADFEVKIRNLLRDIEVAYLDLYVAHRECENSR